MTRPPVPDRRKGRIERCAAPRGEGGEGVIYRGDCRTVLPTLPSDSVQLVVTSPPYNVGQRYGDDGSGDRLPLDEYLAMLSAVLTELLRVLRDGGVLALNLPPSIRVPDEHRAFPLAGWAELHLLATHWLLREPLVWSKTQGDGEPHAATTTFGAPTNPYLRPTHERVIIASKGGYRLPGKSTAWGIDRYLSVVKDVWRLPPGRARRGLPLAFPDELVRRLVLLYSCPGDMVLDSFAGTGTVGRVARQHGREAWMIEREPSHWPLIQVALSAVPRA